MTESYESGLEADLANYDLQRAVAELDRMRNQLDYDETDSHFLEKREEVESDMEEHFARLPNWGDNSGPAENVVKMLESESYSRAVARLREDLQVKNGEVREMEELAG